MNRIKKSIIVSVFILMAGISACQHNKEYKPDKEQMIAGRWDFTEIDNGVAYSVTFHPNHRLTQHYKFIEGGERIRPGEWRICNDTLIIDEKTGRSSLVFETLNDSVMLLWTHDSIPVFFEKAKSVEVE